MMSKSLIQFSPDGGCCVPTLPYYGEGNGGNGSLLQKDLCQRTGLQGTVAVSAPDPAAGHCQPSPPAVTPGHSQASLIQALEGSLLLSPGSWCAQGFLVPSKSLFPQSCGSSVIKSHWPPKSNSLGVLSPFAGSPGLEVCCGSQNFYKSARTSLA